MYVFPIRPPSISIIYAHLFIFLIFFAHFFCNAARGYPGGFFHIVGSKLEMFVCVRTAPVYTVYFSGRIAGAAFEPNKIIYTTITYLNALDYSKR